MCGYCPYIFLILDIVRSHRVLCGLLKGKSQRRLRDPTRTPNCLPWRENKLKRKPWHWQCLTTRDSCQNTFIQTDNSHSEINTKKKNKNTVFFLIASNFLYCVTFCDEEFRLTMLPLTIDKMTIFFFFLSQWNIHSLPNRTLPFLHPNHDPVLYISDALDLP